MITNRVGAIELCSLDISTLTGGYDSLCSDLEAPCFLIRIINASNRDVFISYDGAHNHDYVKAGTVAPLAVQSNSRIPSNIALFHKGQEIFVKGTAGTGYIYLAGYCSG